MAAPHNDRRVETARDSLPASSGGDQTAFLPYQAAALYSAYNPYHHLQEPLTAGPALTPAHRTLADLFAAQYNPTRYDLEPRLAPPSLPLPPGFPSYGLPSPLLYGAGPPTYLPGLPGSPLLNAGLGSPYYHRIYDLEKETKPDCPLPADLSTKRRNGVKTESPPAESCSRSGKRTAKSKTKIRVPKLETVKQEDDQRDDVNNNQGRENSLQNDAKSCDSNALKCQNEPYGALDLVKKDRTKLDTDTVIKADRPDAADKAHCVAKRENNTTSGQAPDGKNADRSAAIIYSGHENVGSTRDIPSSAALRQPRDDIVMFPVVRSLPRDASATSPNTYQPSRTSISAARVGPITAQDASAASAALTLPAREIDSAPKKIHAPTFMPEITIPVKPTSPKTSPSTTSSTPTSSPSPSTKRVYAATFTPEVAADVSGAVRPHKRTLSVSDAKVISPDKKRTLSSSCERRTPEKRRHTSKDGPLERKTKNESIWGCRTPSSPKIATPVNRNEAGKIRLAVDWKAAILGTPRSKESELKNTDCKLVKSENEKTDSKSDTKEAKFESKVEVGSVKSEVKVGGCLKDEKPLGKSTSGNIPVGIAVARQRLEKPKQEVKPSTAQSNQLDLSNKAASMTSSSLVSRDVKQEITTGVLVTGGTGLVSPWPRDTNSATPSWFQTTNQQPTYWLGHAPFLSPPIMNNLDLTSLHGPPMNAMVAPSAGGYKLAQDPITGQLFVIPSPNIDVLDANRLWTTVTGQLQPSLAPAQMIANPLATSQMATNPPALNLTTQNEPSVELQHDTQTNTKPCPDDTPPVAPVVPTPTVDTKPEHLAQPPFAAQQTSFTFANLPFYYDTNVQTEVAATLAPKNEPVAMQSRGTSPMTVASGSPYPETDAPEADVDIVHVEMDKHNVSTQNTAIQTSPDMDQMNEMREQSSQTSEAEKDARESDLVDSNTDDIVESEHDAHEKDDLTELKAHESTSATGSRTVERRRHSDLQSLIRELMPLANAASAEKLTVPLSVQVDDDRIYENSYRNLHSNLSAPGTPSRRWSELAEQYRDEGEMNGLDLLSSIVDKHSEEFRSPDSRQPSGSPRDRLSVGSWDRCNWSEGLASPDRAHHSPYRHDPLGSACSSPTFSTPSKTYPGPWTLTNLDNMDASEIEMRLKLAELQRKYREKQRLLAKLQPKRHNSDNSDKPRQRASHSDDWKKPRKRIKKRRHSTPSTMSKLDRRKQTEHHVAPNLFLKPQMKAMKAPVTDTGLVLLASAAASSDQASPRSAETSPKSPQAFKLSRKPASPRKLEPSTPTKALSPNSSATSLSESAAKASVATKRRSTEARDSDEDEKKRTKTLLDQARTIRRSERIFLSDSVPPQPPETKPATPTTPKPKPKQKFDGERKPKLACDLQAVTIKREAVSPEPDEIEMETVEMREEPELQSAKATCTIEPEFEKRAVAEEGETTQPIAADKGAPEPLEDREPSLDDSKKPSSELVADERVEEFTPDIKRSISATSDESTESDNQPLIKLIVPKKTIIPAKPVLLEERDLTDGQRILLFMEDLFYPAVLKPIQPPDIYGVTVIGGRGSNRPRIMTQEELLREAIFDAAPVCKERLVEGARICAYWSQKFRCLYPGTVAGPDSDEEDDLTEQEKEMIFVEFDDGDSGRIPFDHIRMLPDDFPEIGEGRVPYPILSCEKKPRPPTPPPPPPEPLTPPQKPNPDSKPDGAKKSDDSAEKKVKKKKKKSSDNEKNDTDETQKKKKKKKKRESEESGEKKSGKEHKHKHKKKDKESKDRHESTKKEKHEKKEKSESKKKKIVKVESEEKNDDTTEEGDDLDLEAGGQSRMAGNNRSFLPAQQFWRWSGKGNKRYGVKGKVRKTLYKAIVRGGEEIKVGDCAVFMSTGRPHLPYVGRIDCFWESWSGAMCVRVKWFYHPEETKTSKKLKDMQGALYQTDHRDDNDVQTISHKCDVLPLAEYQKTEREDDSNDLYYLAGSYDPIGGAIDYQPGVE